MTLTDLIAEKGKEFDSWFYANSSRYKAQRAFLSKSLREVAEKTLEAVEVEPRRHGIMYGEVSPENQEIVGAGYNLALAEITRRGKEWVNDNTTK